MKYVINIKQENRINFMHRMESGSSATEMVEFSVEKGRGSLFFLGGTGGDILLTYYLEKR